MLFPKSLRSLDIYKVMNIRNAGSLTLKDVRNAMLCLRGWSNWIGEHSLMTLLWLINYVMIKALQTWQRNRSYRWNVLTWIQMNHWSCRCCFSVVTWVITAGLVTKIFWHLPELGSVLYSIYKIPLAQACFSLARSNFHSHWRVGEC